MLPFAGLVTTGDRGRPIRANYGKDLMYYGGGHFDSFGHRKGGADLVLSMYGPVRYTATGSSVLVSLAGS